MSSNKSAIPTHDYSSGVIHLRYEGRLGNNLFQYCFGRVLSEELQCGLLAPPIDGFALVKSTHMGLASDIYERKISLWQERMDAKLLIKENNKLSHICFSELIDLLQLGNGTKLIDIEGGCFLHVPFYTNYFDKIRHQWLQIPDQYRLEGRDLTIHVRAGDIWQENVTRAPHESYCGLPFSFYQTIIEQQDWQKIYIVTEDAQDPMVCKLAYSYGASIVSGTAIEDFNFIKSSKNIVLAVSTFSWFAAFLSQARRIYYPLAGMFHHEIRPDINLKVDEERYHYQQVYPDGQFQDSFRGIFFSWSPRLEGDK